jgi:O-methyltransferase
MSPIHKTLVEAARSARFEIQIASLLSRRGLDTGLLQRFHRISRHIPCLHDSSHLLQFVADLLRVTSDVNGCIAEAGCFKGGGTAKLSIVASVLNRQLVVFDSFQGLSPNTEPHEANIFGDSIKGRFRTGEFRASLDEVYDSVRMFGGITACRFVEGWFQDTLPRFKGPIAGLYLDVDLASSTATCLKYLYPLISHGGLMYSQDGDFPLVIDIFADHQFWNTQVGCSRPEIVGLGRSKMLKIVKPSCSTDQCTSEVDQ